MDMEQLFRKKHELWLKTMYSSIILRDGRLSIGLHSFSSLFFRQMRWLGNKMVGDISEFDYESSGKELPKMFNFDRDVLLITPKSGKDLLLELKEAAIASSRAIEPEDDVLMERIKSDDNYFASRMGYFVNTYEDIGVDDQAGRGFYYKHKELSPQQIEKITKILHLEHQKEHNTVLSYMYVMVHTAKNEISEIMYDLMVESLSHQRHYARMMASLGVLKFPELIEKKDYQFSDIKSFIMKSIEEEQSEIVDLQRIANETDFPILQNLVQYIYGQEKHHISLLKAAYKMI